MNKAIPLNPVELPPFVRIGFEWRDGDTFEAYSDPSNPEVHLVINRTAHMRSATMAVNYWRAKASELEAMKPLPPLMLPESK